MPTELSEPESAVDESAEALIAAADRKRRRAPRPARPVADLHDAIPTQADPDSEAEDSADDADEAKPVLRRQPRRKPLKARKASEDEVAGPGTVTRGIHAGLESLSWTRGRLVRLGLWGSAAALVIGVLIAVSVYAIGHAPAPMPVSNVRVLYAAGPQLPQAEALALIRSFPGREHLTQGKPEMLAQLAAHLRRLPVVAAVRDISVVHEPDPRDPRRLRRTLEVSLALRQPVMPVVLASGERAWVDGEGWLLPGSLPGPVTRRPVLRAIEWGGVEGVRATLALWRLLEPQVEPGLITDIHLNDTLDARGLTRGIVLYTRHGSRLIWGRPGEERYGVRNEDKVRDLVHTLRAQGDVGRLAAVNVRFKQPFFTLRSSVPAAPAAPPAAPVQGAPRSAPPAAGPGAIARVASANERTRP